MKMIYLLEYLHLEDQKIKAIEYCNFQGNNTILLTGDYDTEITYNKNLIFKVPSTNTPTIQEVHIILLHSLAEEIEKTLRRQK